MERVSGLYEVTTSILLVSVTTDLPKQTLLISNNKISKQLYLAILFSIDNTNINNLPNITVKLEQKIKEI